MRSPPGIELNLVCKQYPGTPEPTTALDNISFEIKPGATLAITGPSACGKSTLLSIMCGLEVPTTGRIAIDESDITRLSQHERARLRRDDFGLVFQRDSLLPFLTAIENVTLHSQIQGKNWGYSHSLEMLAELGLREKVDKLPDQLSGGERQRVALACALIKRPRVILADEPTGSLDSQSSQTVIDYLLTLHRRTHATLVVVTHDLKVAARMASSLSMRDGRLIDTSLTRPG